MSNDSNVTEKHQLKMTLAMGHFESLATEHNLRFPHKISITSHMTHGKQWKAVASGSHQSPNSTCSLGRSNQSNRSNRSQGQVFFGSRSVASGVPGQTGKSVAGHS